MPLQPEAQRRIDEETKQLLFAYRGGWLAHRGLQHYAELASNFLLWLKQDRLDLFEQVTKAKCEEWLNRGDTDDAERNTESSFSAIKSRKDHFI